MHAGRITPQDGLGAAEWERFARGAEHIACHVRDATGLRTCFHHHCAGYVETTDELNFLKNELCNEAQGYLLGRPADIETFRQFTAGGGAIEEQSSVIPLITKAAAG